MSKQVEENLTDEELCGNWTVLKTAPEQPDRARIVCYEITTRFGLDETFDQELEKLITKHIR